MKLYYVSNERFPSQTACTIQQVRMCEAFARAGAKVTLLYPRFFDAPELTAEVLQQYYGVEPIFTLKRLPSLLSLGKPPQNGRFHLRLPLIGGLSFYASASAAARRLSRSSLDEQSVVYCRSVLGAQAFLDRRRSGGRRWKLIFEVHSLERQRPQALFRRIAPRADGLVAISRAAANALVDKLNIDPRRILTAPSAISRRLLDHDVDRREARRRLGWPHEPMVLYAGQFLPGKGVDLLLDAAPRLGARLVLLGGSGAYYRAAVERVRAQRLPVDVIGFVPPTQVPLYLAAADVLILPTTEAFSTAAYTSPLKLFEYMAAHRPVVASDLPALREILRHNKNALLFRSGDVDDLVSQVRRLLNDPRSAERLAQRAFDEVQHYTWEARAESILDFIRRLP